jgi:hypothetical protein
LPEFGHRIIIFILKVLNGTIWMDNMDDLLAQTIEEIASQFFYFHEIKFSFVTFDPMEATAIRDRRRKVDDIPIEECFRKENFQLAGITPRHVKGRIIRGLGNHRIRTIGDIRRYGPEQIRSIKNLGDKGIFALRQVLKVVYEIDL